MSVSGLCNQVNSPNKAANCLLRHRLSSQLKHISCQSLVSLFRRCPSSSSRTAGFSLNCKFMSPTSPIYHQFRHHQVTLLSRVVPSRHPFLPLSARQICSWVWPRSNLCRHCYTRLRTIIHSRCPEMMTINRTRQISAASFAIKWMWRTALKLWTILIPSLITSLIWCQWQ